MTSSEPETDAAESAAGDASTPSLASRFWGMFVRPHWRAVIVAALLMAAVAAANTSYALVVRWSATQLEAGRITAAYWAPALIIGVTAFKAGTLFAQMMVTQRIALRIIEAMQSAMYGRLLRADFARMAGEAPGRLVARFTSDVDRVRDGLTRAATNLIRDALTVVGGVAVMIYIDWLLALLVLGVYPLALQPIANIGHRLRRASTAAQEQMGDLTAFLSESFQGVRLVKTYRLEDYQRERADAAFAERFRLGMKMARGRAGVEPILEIVGGLAFAGVLAFAAWRTTNSDFSIPDLLAFVTALGVIAPAVRAIGTLNAVAQEGLAAVDRVFQIIDEEPDIVDAPDAKPIAVSEGRIQFVNVSFSYGAEAQALSGVDLEIEAGKTTALVGPSGAGKSTVLNLIPRLYDPTQGQVLIDGQDLRGATLQSLRRSISLVSQDITLFDDTLRANIAFGRPDATEDEILAAADAAAALPFIQAAANGLDTRVGPAGGSLSGGQRQRIALARAVLKDAPILLLDEATSALDAESEALVQAALDRLARGRTTLVIAHRLATVTRADKIIVLDAGRVVEQGTDESLRAADGLYARLRALQFES